MTATQNTLHWTLMLLPAGGGPTGSVSRETLRSRKRSDYNLNKVNAPILTNTTLNVIRLVGKYMQMMNILKPIAFDVIHCMSQLFDYYLYAVYTFFGRNDMYESSGLGLISSRLRTTLNRIQESLIDMNNLHDPNQSGFKAAHSKETALLAVTEKLYAARSAKLSSVLILLDLSAAFDTVNHKTLLSTLRSLGICGTAWEWFASYLDGRSYQAQYLVLFSLYTHSLGKVISSHGFSYHCYADDTQLIFSFPPSDTTASARISACLVDISSWMTAHQLKLNPSKTELLIIPGDPSPAQDLAISLNNSMISPSATARNLGVTMDNQLFFSSHVTNVPRSCRFLLYNIGRIWPFLSTQATQVLVQSLVISRLDCCNSLLAGLPLNAIRPLQMIQNAAARLVFNLPKFSHTTPLLRSLHWLPVAARIRFKTLMLAYKAKNGPAPSYLKALVTPCTAPCSLRSTSTAQLVPPTLGEKVYFYIYCCALNVLLYNTENEAGGENAATHGPSEDRKEKVPSPHLSQLVVLTASSTLYGLAERVVATESLVFLAEQFELLQPHLDTMMPPAKKPFLQQFYSQTVSTASELRKPTYWIVAAKAIDYEQMLLLMAGVKWDIKEIMSQHNVYVDVLLKEFEELNKRLGDVSKQVRIPLPVSNVLWEHCIRLANRTLVEGYANVKKCSNEGRALMQLDFQQFLMKLEKLTDLRPIPDKEFVETYIKAYYLTENDMEQFIKNHREYSMKQLANLVNVCLGSHINKKARQKLLAAIDDIDRPKR
ncbi:hypothetical protein QTP86_016704 [Hemibagrus guttatus]|nr:hypothetical protein QTP86_016704 [Hemibagrus guttatus]